MKVSEEEKSIWAEAEYLQSIKVILEGKRYIGRIKAKVSGQDKSI